MKIDKIGFWAVTIILVLGNVYLFATNNSHVDELTIGLILWVFLMHD